MTTKSFIFISALALVGLFSGCATRSAKNSSGALAVEVRSDEHPFGDYQKTQPTVNPAAEIQPGERGMTETTDSTTAYKKAREEFQMAEEAAVKKQISGEAIQRDIDKLNEQKQLWQREIVYTKGKVAFAKESLNHFLTIGRQDEIEKWRAQLNNWETRHKAAVVELEKVEVEIHDTVQTLLSAFNTTESSVILPGESLEIFVKEDDTLNGPYQVRQGGYIMMKNVGRIMVAGKDLHDAEQAIRDELGKNYIQNATVMVDRPQGANMGDGSVIYLAGEFLRPGAWKIPTGLSPTITTTILRSGGLKESADLTKVKLLRLVNGQGLVEEVNVKAILHGAGQPSDLALKPGDIVMVPAYANVVYVSGNVVKPGAIKLLPDDELTTYSAILRCGGFARFANRSKVYVVRDMGNGAKQRISVNIKEVLSGKGSDIILKSKDIVVVPEKFFSF